VAEACYKEAILAMLCWITILGRRPRVFVSESRIDALRGAGASWRAISKELGIALGTVHRTAQGRTKKRDEGFGTGLGKNDPVL
jgi:hypothetical protein